MKSRYIEKNELRELMNVLPKKASLPFEVSLATGLRIGDVLKIRNTDIDKQGVLHYVSEKCSKCGFVQLSPDIVKRLKVNANGKDFCFPSSRSKSGHLTRQAAWKRLKVACDRACLLSDGVSPHSMRKVFAVNLYKTQGIDAVKKALQHERTDTTQIYALADFSTGSSADNPILRRELSFIVDCVIQQLRSMRPEYFD